MSIRRRLLPVALLPGVVCAFVAARPPAVRQLRQLPTFLAVSLGTSATVVVRQGSPQRVTVEAAPDDQAKIETEVIDQQLRIRKTAAAGKQSWLEELRHVGVQFSGPVTVYVTLPVVQALTVSGSGRLEVDTLRERAVQLAVSGSGRLRAGQVQAGRVQAKLSGSGSMALGRVQADSLRGAVSGSGSLTAAGRSSYAELSSNSSGSLYASELAVQDCQTRLGGSGSALVLVAHHLDARLSGSGSVLVRGNPQISSHVSGSGRVRAN